MDPSLESPGMLINKRAHAMALELDRRLRAYDVTMSQWVVLKQLWRQGWRSQVELQELLGLERATVNGLVQRITRSGLIRCERLILIVGEFFAARYRAWLGVVLLPFAIFLGLFVVLGGV